MSGRVFVVGDIHGCPDELAALLEALRPRPDDRFVFLGDYIDRGPSPKDVVEILLDLESRGVPCTFLRGNHEDMFLDYLGLGGRHGDAFLFNGGEATLASYGLRAGARSELASRLPETHRRFFEKLVLWERLGDVLCVHAGLRPGRSLEEQDPEDLVWIREEFLWNPHDFGFTVLFGHTPHREVFVDLPYKVGLDTGLVYGNKLSCLELGEPRLFQVRRGSKEVRELEFRWERALRPSSPRGGA
ncbi:MAG: serine/threonine protein phosphatase [Candidatus Binatia bacterium]|nr:MAG: serine/threonine protein phosphatase [Candidatus Binatia bacterium]